MRLGRVERDPTVAGPVTRPGPRRSGCAWTSTPACGCSTVASASAPSARPCTPPRDAAGLAREIAARERLRLVGIMAYESQIAGLGDAPPGRRLRGAAIQMRCSGALPASLRRAAPKR